MVKNKKIILIGAPGSGKGTLSNHLTKKYHFLHISTGDLFREIIKNNGPLANKLKSIVATGALVDDATTNEIVQAKILNLIKQDANFILDGYPRSLEQAKFLSSYMTPDLLLLIDVKQDLAIKRIEGRLMCPHCGAIYNTYFKKPRIDNVCDIDQATLIKRKDDNLQSATNRFQIYEQSAKALVAFYEKTNRLHRIDANNGIKDVIPQIEKLIEDN